MGSKVALLLRSHVKGVFITTPLSYGTLITSPLIASLNQESTTTNLRLKNFQRVIGLAFNSRCYILDQPEI